MSRSKYSHHQTIWSRAMLRSVAFLPLAGFFLVFLHPTRGTAQTRPTLLFAAVAVESHRDSTFPPNPGAREDALALGNALDAQINKLYSDVQTLTLLDDHATLTSVRKQLPQFAAQARPGDTLIVCLILHTIVDSATGHRLFLLHDTSHDTTEQTAMDQTALLETVARATPPGVHVLWLADTMRGLGREGTTTASSGSRFMQFGEPAPLEESGYPTPAGWSQITAGTCGPGLDNGLEDGGDAPTSCDRIFSQVIQDAWSTRAADQDGDGLISFKEFHTHVVRRTRTLSGGREVPESSGIPTAAPFLWGPGSEERCNLIDDDGDGTVDEGFDQDQDGHRSALLCTPSFGDDCDDADPTIHPGQDDLWTGKPGDDDCDGLLDEDEKDTDGDGIPDVWMTYRNRLRHIKWTSFATGVVLFAGSAVAVSALNRMQPSVEGDYHVAARVDRYTRTSLAAAGSAALGTAAIGVSGTFAFRQLRFEARYLDFSFLRRRHRKDAEEGSPQAHLGEHAVLQ